MNIRFIADMPDGTLSETIEPGVSENYARPLIEAGYAVEITDKEAEEAEEYYYAICWYNER